MRVRVRGSLILTLTLHPNPHPHPHQGFEHLFQHDEEDATALCGLGERGTPTCNNCLGHIKADATIAWDEHFKHLPDGVRQPLFDDYVEEITAWVLGAGKALPFLVRVRVRITLTPALTLTLTLPLCVTLSLTLTLTTGKALPFWQQCFLSESGSLRLFKTQPGSEEHIRLWQET